MRWPHSAKLVGVGHREVTAGYNTVNAGYSGQNAHGQNEVGAQAAFGVADIALSSAWG